jgi:Tfp pilus assembly protein PilF
MTRWEKTITSIGVLLLVVALLTSCSGFAPSVAPPPALSEKKEVTSEDLLLVDQLLLAGKYEDAVLQLQKLGQIDPKNNAVQDKLATATAEWKFTEAQTLVAVGAYAEAIKKMKTALDVLPNDKRILTAMDEAYLNLGKKYLELLDVARAKEALLAVNYDQNFRLQAQGLMNLDVQAVDNTQKGYQALQAGDYTMAMSYFRAALQLKPDLAQAQSGMKATETMFAVRPTSFPQTFVQPTYPSAYIPPSGTEQPATTQPTESNSWEKPASSGAGTSDWGQFKQWMENEINGNQMSGNAINENPLLDFENLAKIEDPQAYNYLAESDFANSLYLTAIKIYGERALYIASEIPRIFPLPNSLDPNYQTARQRIQRLLKSASFVDEGVRGLRAPTIFKATQKNLQALIDNELASLTSSSIAGLFAPPEAGQLSDQSQAYVDEFDLAQSKVLMVPFSQLPSWAQVKRYYIEASLNAYMLNEVASDFERLLPLPQIAPEQEASPEEYPVTQGFGPLLLTLTASSSYSPTAGYVDIVVTPEVINPNETFVTEITANVRMVIPAVFEIINNGGCTLTQTSEGYLLSQLVNTIGVLPNITLRVLQSDFSQNQFVSGYLEVLNPFLQLNIGSDWLRVTPPTPRVNDIIDIRYGISVNPTETTTTDTIPKEPKLSTLRILIPDVTEIAGFTPGGFITVIDGKNYIEWRFNPEDIKDYSFEYFLQLRPKANTTGKQILVVATRDEKKNGPLVLTVFDPNIRAILPIKLPGTPISPDPTSRATLEELIRLIRYSENLHWNLSTTRTPSALDIVSTGNLVRAANELASSLYWIPIKWAQLSQLPYEYFVSYPAYSTGLVDLPNAASLFDLVTGVVVKNPDSYLTISADLTTQFGTPESWKDMIEFLRAQLLQRLAELGYR